MEGEVDEVANDICHAHLTQNNQLTVEKPVRESLNIKQKDLVFFRIIKVISPEGDIKYKGGNAKCQV